MSKGKKRVWKLWNKLMQLDFLPVVWGALLVIIITSVLGSLGIVSVRWLLSLLGVIV